MNRLFLFGFCVLSGCKKFLDKDPNLSRATPHDVAAYQGIMDQASLTTVSTPGLGIMLVNDFWCTPAVLSKMDSITLGFYTWQPAFFLNGIELSWSHPYTAIYSCNTVLAGLPALTGLDSLDRAQAQFVMGQAYFDRAFLFYNVEETFGQPYRAGSAATDPGVPLRTSDDPMQRVPRSSVGAVYDAITSDLGKAVGLLPSGVQWDNPNRACRPAAYALLAKVWLTREDYVKARLYADSCLRLYNGLIDYNGVDSTAAHPFAAGGNPEVMFQCSANNYLLQYSRTTLIDTVLYGSYDRDDLRRAVYFASAGGSNYYFKGQYTGIFYLFSGLAVDEVYLIRAESNARNGDIAAALADLDTVMIKRWRSGRFQPFTASTQDEAIGLILREKRKEILFREGRWFDERRLNKGPGPYADTLTRWYNGQAFSLMPGSLRYALPIPPQEVNLGGVVQNPE
jgi:hypothetical protein